MQGAATDTGADGGVWRLLRAQPSFRGQFVGYLASMLGDQVGWIALVWLVLRLTGSAAAVGVATLVYIGPQAFAGPFAGALLDRFGRARTMAAANAGIALSLAAVAMLAGVAGARALGPMYALVALAGALMSFNTAGRIALVPELVPAQWVGRANFLSQSAGQLAWLVGPAVGGVLVSLVGSNALLWADSATYVVLALALRGISGVGPATDRPADAGHDVWAGLRYVAGRRELLALALFTVLFNFFYGPFEVLLPDMARTVLGGAWALGLLWSAFGVGSLVTTAVLSGWRGRLTPSRSFTAIVLAWALVALAMSRVGSVAEGAAVMFVGGALYSPWAGLYATVLQGAVPAPLRARVAGAQSAATVLGMPLGAFVTGLALRLVAGRTLFVLSATATALVGLAALFSPALRRFDRPDP